MLSSGLYICHLRWRCSSFEECSQQSRWAEFFSAGWATAWQWEDASNSLSLLFNLLFSQSVAARFPVSISLYAAVQGRSFNHMKPEGTAWLQMPSLTCSCIEKPFFFSSILSKDINKWIVNSFYLLRHSYNCHN